MRLIKREEYQLKLNEGFVELVLSEGVKLTTEVMKRQTYDRLSLQNGIIYPILIDATGVRDYYSQETSRYMSSPEANSLLSRVAVVVANESWHFIFNIYLSINPSSADINVFLNSQEAKKWILEEVMV